MASPGAAVQTKLKEPFMRLAILFPGQGSQSVGMLSGFTGNAAAESVMRRAGEALGEDLVRLCSEGPADKLNLTVNTQPALLAASVAFYEAYREAGGPEPAVMAGHSLGEYSALTAAGSLELEEAVPLVRFRARAMQEAVPVGRGGMAAILGLSDEDVRAACAEASAAGVVEPVNFNCPGQVVIAGISEALERACELCRQKGAKRALRLAVSAPFHSSLLKPARDRLAQRLESTGVKPCRIPVYANVDARLHTTPEAIRGALARQACSPVLWSSIMAEMKRAGVTHMIECGPGRVLSGLARRCVPDIPCYSVSSEETLEAALRAIS